MAKSSLQCIPSRLVYARKRKNLSQADLGKLINEKLPEGKEITVPYISLWETGRRSCAQKYHKILAEILDCSEEYLCGLTDSINSTASSTSSTEHKEYLRTVPIDLKDIFKYDKQPIYLVYRNYDKAKWGIYNREKNEIVCVDERIQINDYFVRTIDLFAGVPIYDIPYEDIYSNRMSFRKVIESDHVYVIMRSKDQQTHAIYYGWYRHNETHSALINDRGLVLPYEGLGISYIAYSDNL